MKKVYPLLVYCISVISCAWAQDSSVVFIESPEAHMFERIHQETKEVITPSILVLHYTAVSLAYTLKIFLGYTSAQASSHYTISEDGIVFQHVPEAVAARHAGKGDNSYWRGVADLNQYALGIEHVNDGFKWREEQPGGVVIDGSDKQWYPFDKRQIAATIQLCKSILDRYGIDPRNVVGHSDVAPGRKQDPGPLFPWQELANNGIGAWPEAQKSEMLSCLQTAYERDSVDAWMLEHLSIWGYKSPDEKTTAQDILQAFQMHFRPANISGVADKETVLILNALIHQYVLAHGTVTCSCSFSSNDQD